MAFNLWSIATIDLYFLPFTTNTGWSKVDISLYAVTGSFHPYFTIILVIAIATCSPVGNNRAREQLQTPLYWSAGFLFCLILIFYIISQTLGCNVLVRCSEQSQNSSVRLSVHTSSSLCLRLFFLRCLFLLKFISTDETHLSIVCSNESVRLDWTAQGNEHGGP